MDDKTFTGIRRQRKTRPSVKFADRTARTLITVGGIGTILSVLLICFFLVWVVLPLFRGGELVHEQAVAEGGGSRVLHLGMDEYRTLSWAYRADGSVTIRRIDTGEVIETRRLFPEGAPTAEVFPVGTSEAVFGFADGTIRLARFDFRTAFRSTDGLDDALVEKLRAGGLVTLDGGIAQLTPEGQVRIQNLASEVDAPTQLGLTSPIALVDYSRRPRGPEFVALARDGRVVIREGRKHPLRNTVVFTGAGTTFTPELPAGRSLPDRMLLNGVGTGLFLVWSDGFSIRYNTSDLAAIREAERTDLVEDPAARVSAVAWLNGKSTILVGDDRGVTHVWFTAKPPDAETVDGEVLVRAGTLDGPACAVTALAPSWRTRIAAVGYADGTAALFHVTTRSRVAEGEARRGSPIDAIVISPRQDGVLAATPDGLWAWDLDAKHPDVTIRSLFFPVQYEGYPEPVQTWQSSGGTDDFEPKLGLLPLVFGTLKATLYSMLFGLPLALLAAVFASEFLHPRAKARVKPTIEIMASLPSVVLGFLAALVIAPFLADRIAATLASFVTIPFAVLLGAHLWQLLPSEASIRLRRFRFPLIMLTVPLGILLAVAVAPAVERLLFAGDIRGWLDGRAGGGLGGWFFLLLPLCSVLTAFLVSRFVGPFLRSVSANWERRSGALLDLVKFAGSVLSTLLTSLVLAIVLDTAGLDPRGSVVGTWVQRNALIVGFVMGFAIIPIIFTIAEDALSSVPDHLRSASLGAGATTWQTAVRIVIPTAMSGLFSATMIGLGRAVGETMIVLMAAGNTPIMEWNIFNGFRTLSANLATELPEAVVGSTHYRVLFLAALVLFLITFIVNTAAEAIRIRFRKRAFQL